MPTLHTTALSANGRKPLLLARRLELDLEIETVNVYVGEGLAPEYRKLNPWGKIPTLVDGDLVLWESNAILTYLVEEYAENALWASAPGRRGEISRWLFWESSHWQPALITVLAEPVGRLLTGTAPAKGATPKWEHPSLAPLLDHLEELLGKSPFLAGDELTLADLSVGAMTMYLGPVSYTHLTLPTKA